MAWSAAQYVKFEDERTRPARDLLAQVPDLPDGALYDLGCGPGNSTELIAERFESRAPVGIDSDDDMLAAAAKRLPQLTFEKGDLADWQPSAPAALFYANAVFQWLPGHLDILERLMGGLVSGGALAVQMPDNLMEPSHVAMREVAAEASFAAHFAKDPRNRNALPSPAVYIDRLAPLSAKIEVWHTIYYHRLANAEAIVEWVKGTGLRPYLDALPDELRADYAAAYLKRIRTAYPPLADGRVLLKFPRLFIVAVRS
ncbi:MULTISPECIES: trans-aconitate 2-methyltransferase [unclassified Rhizobium]|uniref:trans-aconitate 2-methyltransferase n=1 Tax=unclassified Rhizobium TaxID=2613769 RepID=UPI0006F682FC|nr:MULTISPECIES: trans-aconitate 2-methyltransferase [unclassified Rhizobium]KQV43574.1 trans-aconitate methyltransferase [Rhizobium sp. Root1212]KRD37758.1 trans-aconitate methyltransferase [Rhizobium sp. Root268]